MPYRTSTVAIRDTSRCGSPVGNSAHLIRFIAFPEDLALFTPSCYVEVYAVAEGVQSATEKPGDRPSRLVGVSDCVEIPISSRHLTSLLSRKPRWISEAPVVHLVIRFH